MSMSPREPIQMWCSKHQSWFPSALALSFILFTQVSVLLFFFNFAQEVEAEAKSVSEMTDNNPGGVEDMIQLRYCEEIVIFPASAVL